MKKFLGLICSFIVIICLCKTASASAEEIEVDDIWQCTFYKDVFGDETDELYFYNQIPFDGIHSNEFYEDREIDADVYLDDEGVYFSITDRESGEILTKYPEKTWFIGKIKLPGVGKRDIEAYSDLRKKVIVLDEIEDIGSGARLADFLAELGGNISIYLENEENFEDTYLFTIESSNLRSLVLSAQAQDAEMELLNCWDRRLLQYAAFDEQAFPMVERIAYSLDKEHYTVLSTFPGAYGTITMITCVSRYLLCEGIYILDHHETSGLGAVAASFSNAGNQFRDQFIGQGADVALTKMDGTIDALAGATITSLAVTNAVASSISAVASLDMPTITLPPDAKTVQKMEPGVFGEPVVVEIVADESTIYAVTVVEHNETEGIGSVAAETLPAKIVARQTAEVDAMSGATMTSTAIRNAVAAALEEIGFVGGEPVAATEVEAAASTEPMTITVSEAGVFGEPVVVEVVADANTIYSVTVTEHNETEGIGSLAVAELPGVIVEKQTADVDGVSGATMTSNAIRKAVAAALEKVGFGA